MPSSRSSYLLAFLLAASASALAQETRVLVTFHGDPDEDVVLRAGGRIVGGSAPSRLLAATLPPGRIADVASHPSVASVQEDRQVTAAVVRGSARPGGGGGTQPAQVTPWGIDRIDAPEAWGTTAGAGIRIAVVDTGIKNDHADFRNASGTSRVVLGPTFTNSKTSKDDNGHGTHVAGSAGASNNSIGVVGVAPACTLIAVKVLDRQGSGWLSDVIAGIDWAADNSDVINLSLGSTSDVQALEDSVDAAVAAGVVVCAAAGNDGDAGSPPSYPGAYPSAIAVAATSSTDAAAVWSTRGSYVDIAAPGVSILSTWKDGSYVTISGTSMATPHVAGAAALLAATGLSSVADIRAALQGTADDVNAATLPGSDSTLGSGLLDVQEAVTGTASTP